MFHLFFPYVVFMCEHTGRALLIDESLCKFRLFITLVTTVGFFLYSQTNFKPTIPYWSSSQAFLIAMARPREFAARSLRDTLVSCTCMRQMLYMDRAGAGLNVVGKLVKYACAKSYSRHQQGWPCNQAAFLLSPGVFVGPLGLIGVLNTNIIIDH